MFSVLRTTDVGASIPARIVSALDRKPSVNDLPPAMVQMSKDDDKPAPIVELIRGAPGLLQIDGLVAAVLVELGAPHFVRALMLGGTEADGRPETHVEITHGF